ncbi:MAG: alcohol dehydrogenase family protein [Thermoanaerobaculia bacterium]
MRALTFHGPEDIRHETVADPRLESLTDVIVRVTQAAICGSDLHVYFGRERGLDPGTVMGHEFLGEVIEVGSGVRGLSVGDRVVSPFTTNCGTCFYCLQGLTCRCEQGQLFGWVQSSNGLHGAQAEFVRVPLADSSLVKLPDGISESEALFAGDILATGMFAADLAEIQIDSTVVVVGCGPVGLMAAIAAQEKNPVRVYAVDSISERLQLAQGLGATPLSLSSNGSADLVIQTILDVTNGRGADAVLEVVGSPAALRLAYDLIRPGGVIASVGVHTETHLEFSPLEAYDKNLTYRTGRCPARKYMEDILQLVQAERYDLASIVSHRLPLSQGPEGYRIFAHKLDRCTKVVLTPEG